MYEGTATSQVEPSLWNNATGTVLLDDIGRLSNGDSVDSGTQEMLMCFFGWTVFWTVLFYILAFTSDYWMRGIPLSSKAHENDRYWCARNLIGAIHAALVALLTVPVYLILCNYSEDLRFATSRHLATCSAKITDTILPEGREAEFSLIFQCVAMAGLIFTAFTLADVFISIFHGLATFDFIAHHVAFITAGLIIRGHCMLPFNAAILLAMEISTPSLNYVLFFRNRGETYKSAVTVNGILFVFFYIIFRLGINVYGCVLLWMRRESAMKEGIAEWEAWFLLIAVTAGVAVQLFWFPGIMRTFSEGLKMLFCGSLADDDKSGSTSTDNSNSEGESQPVLEKNS